MQVSLRTKLGLILLFISIFLSFYVFLFRTENPEKTDLNPASENQGSEEPRENKFKVALAPTPFIKRNGKAKGLNSSVKFEKDFETSLKIQQLPKVWLEFTDEYDRVIIVEIPKPAEEILQKRWIKTLEYSFRNQSTNDRNIKLEINENYLNDTIVFAQKLENFEINTPFEKRKISLEEGFAIMGLTAKFAIERYEELQNMSSHTIPQKISE